MAAKIPNSVYDPITGTTETETVPDNVRRIPKPKPR